MVLKLYGVASWSNTQRVIVILNEKNVPFEIHTVDVKNGEQKSPAYLEKQPFGETPYIDDDGFILYESRAIAYYIAAKYANQGTQGLIPTGLQADALFRQALSNEHSNFEGAVMPYLDATLYKTYFGLPVDQDAAAKALRLLQSKLDVYEKILSKQRFVAGNELTLADLLHLPYGEYLVMAGLDVFTSKERPNLARWWKEISSRPSWQARKKPAREFVNEDLGL